MTRFLATDSAQLAVQELDFEVLLRAAVFKSTNQLMACLFQKLADRIHASCQPKSGYAMATCSHLTSTFSSFLVRALPGSHPVKSPFNFLLPIVAH